MTNCTNNTLVKVTLAVVKQLKQLQRKPPKKLWGSNGIWNHDLRDTGRPTLYQLSYEASLEAGQEWVQFIPVIWRE